MSALITADLHLTDNPKDEYRWGLFDWLETKVNKYKVTDVLLLGDITDFKDRHSSILVNRFVTALSSLGSMTRVIILRGNHDFISEQHPFMEFTSQLDANIIYVNEPKKLNITELGDSLFLPCTRDYVTAWQGLDFKKFAYIFTHQTFNGAKSENGTALTGVPPSAFAGTKARVISGDIHVCQTVGKNIEYVGSPYRVHFGDSFTPRVMLLQGSERGVETKDLHFPCLQRHTLEVPGIGTKDISELLRPLLDTCARGDQLKIRVTLKRSDYGDWPKLRKEVQALVSEREMELCGLELKAPLENRPEPVQIQDSNLPNDVLCQYIKTKKLGSDMSKMGRELLKEAQAE